MFYVYILKSTINGDIYIGFSDDLKRRFKEHNSGRVFSTKPYKPWILIYYESYSDKRDATIREKQLKNHKAKNDLKLQLKFSLN